MINDLLIAAMDAPSVRNLQPWHFIVIDDRKVLDIIPKIHPYAEMVYKAPLAILICGDKKLEKTVEYIGIDCAAATQNILLAAHNSGLGVVWLGVYPRKERMSGLSGLFELPDDIIPISLVSIGYPNESKVAEDRFSRERIHKNKW